MKILLDILNQKDKRKLLIRQFQEEVWNDKKFSSNDKINELLNQLAYDLDFYEPNEKLQNEYSSYYGDYQLEKELKSIIDKIQHLGYNFK